MADPGLIDTIFYTTAAGLGATGLGAGIGKLFSLGTAVAKVQVKLDELCERVEKVENKMPNGEWQEINTKLDRLLER
jgi:hypothetical protein